MRKNKDYLEYLASKQISAKPSGFDVDLEDLHSIHFDWQRLGIQWALKIGKAAMFWERGLGKTLAQLEFANQVHKHTKDRVLIVCPLAVARQTIREAQKLNLEVEQVRSMDDVKMADSPITIINYDMFRKFEYDDAKYFTGLVLDECLVGDTSIDTAEGTKRIADIKPGDYVYNALGKSKVRATHKRYKHHLVLTSIQGRDIISSENHPFLTHRGWVKAKDLKEGDYVIYTRDAVRLVQQAANREADRQLEGQAESETKLETFLQQELLREVEDVSAGNQGKMLHPRSQSQGREKDISLAQQRQPQSSSQFGADTIAQSNIKTRCEGQNIQKIERDRTQAAGSGREWKRDASASEDATGSFGRGMDSRVYSEFGQEAGGLSHTLQNRYSQSSIDDSNRGGRLWSRGSKAEGERQKEGCQAKAARVDSVTIYEQTNPIFDRYRDETGRVALYDLEVEGHPSFSVNGLLVHNSSILKGFQGATKKFILRFAEPIPYRLFCTATPSPNDYMELGHHSEGLGVMASTQMLSNWFMTSSRVSSGEIVAGKYIIREFAKRDFWRWITTWAMVVSQPSDLGFSDDGYIRPPLDIRYHLVNVDHRRAWDTMTKKGQRYLMLGDSLSATEMWRDKKATYTNRSNLTVELTEAEPDEYHIIWCDLNDESKYIYEQLSALYPDEVVEVQGQESLENKESKLDAFSRGDVRIIVTKSKIAGMGLNWQHCARQKFVSTNYKWEEWYQSVGRTDRFGNERQTKVDMIYTETEQGIVKALGRKGKQHAEMQQEVNKIISEFGLWRTGRKELVTNLGDMEMELPKWLR